jgi:flagellar basal-body rod protein FlgF
MIRGIYGSASALDAYLRRQEAVAHNLANVSTTGFKQQRVMVAEGGDMALVLQTGAGTSDTIGSLPAGVATTEGMIDFSQGPLQNTQRSLDLAIAGEGFFRIQTPTGERLTRDGTFYADSAGRLCTADGGFLLGEAGPILVNGATPVVTEDGYVFVPGQAAPAGRISLAAVQDPATLDVEENGVFTPTTPVQILTPGGGGTQIKQGFLEGSNVDVAGSITAMMLGLRSYQAAQRSLQMQDETLQNLMEVGRTA